MPRKGYKSEEIVARLRRVYVLVIAGGQNIGDAIRQIGVSEVYYKRRQEYGGLQFYEDPLYLNL